MAKNEKIIVGISLGDYNGIGSEIILKTFEDSRMLDFCTPVIFASVKLMSFFKKHYNLEINLHGIDKVEDIIHKKVNVLNVWKENIEVQFGEVTQQAGDYAIKSLEASVKALKTGAIDVLVTAPINKSNIQSKSFNFPGHTNYLAKQLNGKSLMLMISNTIRVGLLTDHVPVKDVTSTITKNLIIDKINTVYQTLIQDFCLIKPKIAVLGINPHNGDHGVIGTEDDTLVLPTLEEIRNTGKLVYGPYAADSFFGSGNYKNFDAIIASYHDQGLIPFKTLSFGQGVNYTAGLEKIRTSPDHGTAYEIAGKNEANENSFKEAVFAAIEIYNNREEYKVNSSNPLKTTPKKAYSKKNF